MKPTVLALTVGGLVLAATDIPAQSPALANWNALQAKRSALANFHQEFDVEQTLTWRGSDKRASKWVTVIDVQGPLWRQTVGRGSAANIALYDGRDQFEIDGTEVVRVQRKSKEFRPTAGIYNFANLDLSKLVEAGRRPCGFNVDDRPCVVFDVPVRDSMTQTLSGVTRAAGGASRLVFDSETGLLVVRTLSQPVSRERDSYRADVLGKLTRVSYDGAPAHLFSLPPDLREVKKFTPWNAKRMNGSLSGKPAPDLSVTTLDGKTVSLESLKGKTVLLDFWTTWCPECRVDGPALDKLHAKYGSRLAIVGVSVNETREVVEKYLVKNPHSFPIVLTAESELPRTYDVTVLPTYIIVDAEGNFEAAVEGEKGFDGLRDRLKKAGLAVD